MEGFSSSSFWRLLGDYSCGALAFALRLVLRCLPRADRHILQPSPQPQSRLHRPPRYATLSSNVPMRNVHYIATDSPPPASSVTLTCGWDSDHVGTQARTYGCVLEHGGVSSTRGSTGEVHLSETR